ncbi:MAG: biotin--[acetyl-CoA-carboxylase] ligase [Parasporobacterium sp.]|nr:biotin--[acetyl-CoA-carboxylase] ligase [Parasporobacterium sp.]
MQVKPVRSEILNLADGKNITVYHFGNVESTNDIAKEMAGEVEGEFVVIADSQSGGKGQKGRSFYSPAGKGLYLSLLVRPNKPLAEMLKITTIAAFATAKSVEKVSGQPTEIKWVNDILLRGKKIAGILTEAKAKDDGIADYVIIGIGLNVLEPEEGYPADIKDIAGAVYTKSQIENLNVGEQQLQNFEIDLINKLMSYYANFDKEKYVSQYKAKCTFLGKDIEVTDSKGTRKAKAVDIDENYGLIVEYEGGEKESLISAEIKVL